MEIIKHYFSSLTENQTVRFEKMLDIYKFWNDKINVISRKDMDNFYIHHVLHSLSICKVIDFKPKTVVTDIGTGGGFPGIPLAVFFPDVQFILADSIAKKIKVVNEVVNELGIQNVETHVSRVEELKIKTDFVVSRAVTETPTMLKWMKNKFSNINNNTLENGFIFLKGGNLENELQTIKNQIIQYNISEFFKEDFFETKKVVYVKK